MSTQEKPYPKSAEVPKKKKRFSSISRRAKTDRRATVDMGNAEINVTKSRSATTVEAPKEEVDSKKMRRRSRMTTIQAILREAKNGGGDSDKGKRKESSLPKIDVENKKEEEEVKEEKELSEKEDKIEEEKEPEPEPEPEIIDDGKDYGDSVFFLPDLPRIIVYSEKSPYAIQYASYYKLLEKVTTPDIGQEYQDFLKVFSMTYRSFMDAEMVMELVIKRFKGPDPETLNDEEKEKLATELPLARQGVCKFLVHWFTNHWRDFSGRPIGKTLENFIEWVLENDPPQKSNFTGYLHKMYEKKSGKGTYTSLFDSSINVDQSNCPDPIIPKGDWKQMGLMDIDELEVARQLTITEYHIYAEIQPVELQELAWSKPKLKHLATDLLRMIDQFNKFSNAVSSLVVSQPKIKVRKKVIEKLVRIAEHLMSMNSFNMVMAIMSGFENAAVHRLHHSFAGISKKSQESIASIKATLSSANSYKVYRDMLSNVKPPCIPFLGVYLSDLTFIDEGNPKIVNGLVNFRKKQLEYGVIVQVLRFQNHAYHFKLLPKFAQVFKKLPSMTDKELYDASLEAEPRKAKRKDIK